MQGFLDWFDGRTDIDPVLKAGLRICGSSPSTRSMTATGVSRVRSPTWRSRAPKTVRSAFTACRRRSASERKDYYDILERTQKGDLDITPWLEWFLAALAALLMARRQRSPPFSARRVSGTASA